MLYLSPQLSKSLSKFFQNSRTLSNPISKFWIMYYQPSISSSHAAPLTPYEVCTCTLIAQTLRPATRTCSRLIFNPGSARRRNSRLAAPETTDSNSATGPSKSSAPAGLTLVYKLLLKSASSQYEPVIQFPKKCLNPQFQTWIYGGNRYPRVTQSKFQTIENKS